MKKVKKHNQHFSVLMSVYYKENPEFLDLALESILIKQTVLPTEIVMVEDGKLTEELESILNKYQEKFPDILKLYPLEENMGLGKALQYGLEKCQYDIVMRMDTDDISVANRFEKQLNYMKKHKDVVAIGGYIGEFDSSPNEKTRLKKMPITFPEVLKYARFRNPINHMTVCFRKKDILEVGNYQPLYFLEDHFLWARLLFSGKKIENIPEILVYARIGNGFYSRRGNKNYIKGWIFLQNYLYRNKFINYFEKKRNILGMYTMVYVPPKFRTFLYNNILREK